MMVPKFRKNLLQLILLILIFFASCKMLVYRDQLVISVDNPELNKQEVPKEGEVVIATEKYGEEFCVAYKVTKSQRKFREDGMEPISLAVHLTPSFIPYVLEQVATWYGPISVAMFIDRNSQSAVELLYNLYSCEETFSDKISLHIVFRQTAFQGSCDPMTIRRRSCKEINYKTVTAAVKQMIPPFTIYPINVMRNVARRGAPSNLHLIADVEMIFSQDFTNIAKKLAHENICEDCQNLIVVRRFELESNVTVVPRTIAALNTSIAAQSIFEFHHKFFPLGHTIPGLWHWLKVSTPNDKPTAWEIPYKSPAWEPQVIMHASAPYNDENFPTRVRDQQALAYELCRSNYTFLLASHLFNVHRGVKKSSGNLDKAIEQHQYRLKEKALKEYRKRLDDLYPNTTARCSKFYM